MHVTHPVVIPPENENQPLWRYQDLGQLLNLVQTARLFFCRIDKLGDPFEGSLPKKNEELRRTRFQEVLNRMPISAAEFSEKKTSLNRYLRLGMFVNCWHMNTVESAAMWNLYGRNSFSVAVRSSYSKLSRAFDVTDLEVRIGKVSYVDYDSEVFDEANAFNLILHKRLSFEHERELRAFIWPSEEEIAELKKADLGTDEGIYVSVDLNSLIDEMYVSPSAPNWFAETVKRSVRNSGLGHPIRHSKLNDEPFF
jgi:hypothetical protein